MTNYIAPERSNSIPARKSDTRRLIAISAVVLVSLLVMVARPVSADDDTRGINGTVLSVGSTSIRIAAKSGLETVLVDSDTEIKRQRKTIELSDIAPGDKISVELESIIRDQLLATKIKVRGKSSSKQVQHLTGVVIEQSEGSFKLASRNGRTVEIEVEEGENPPEIAEVITTIVENDLATGRIKAKQIDRIEKIVQRLENSLSKQVDKVKAQVLKRIIDESARQHLNTLNQTLDEVDAEAKAKIQAALTKFRTDYAGVAERVGNSPPEESYEGVIANITASTITVGNAGGSRGFSIATETLITIDAVSGASTVDLIQGQLVVVSFIPQPDESGSDPVALTIEVLPPALPAVVADEVEELSDGVIEGEITVVESDTNTDTEVIILEETGTGDTIGVEVTDETMIVVDGEPATPEDLTPEQDVEITVEEDGVTADTIVVTTVDAPPDAVEISGIVSGNDADRGVIVIAPANGEPIRLEVFADALITLDGAVATLADIQVSDVVLQTSHYLPDSSTITRLAIARPVGSTPEPEQPSGEEGTGSTGGGESEGESTTTRLPFSISGFLESFDGDFWVFDSMTLPKSSGITLPDGVTAGSEVNLTFTIAEDGTVILTGVQAP